MTKSSGSVENEATVKIGSDGPTGTNEVKNSLDTGSGSDASAKTGDETPVAQMVALAVMALVLLSVGIVYRRRRK